MKVALVYDRINKWGGAERVLLALHELFPQAPLYTSVYNKQTAQWAGVFPEIYTSVFQKVPFLRTRHNLIPFLMPFAFESFNFDEYDLVISVTSEFAKGIITKPGTLHICYCLTPTRYLWSGYKQYLGGAKGKLSKPIIFYLKKWDRIAAQRPDVMIGISKTVCDRIKTYYGKDARLIYPPVNVPNEPQVTSHESRSYHLVVSRLVPYKKVDLVIRLFNRMNKLLVIVGVGSEEGKLKRIAGKNIHFVGNVTDSQLAVYYQNCKALIFPQEEDFGITAVEAQTFGRPVIAYKKGGVTETVIEDKTGTFFEHQTEESLKNALNKFESLAFNPNDCYQNAQNFSQEKFKKKFATLISKLLPPTQKS